MTRLWIIGAGGFGAEVLGTLRSTWRPGGDGAVELAFAVDDPDADSFLGVPVHPLGDVAAGDSFVIAIGAGAVRRRLHQTLTARGALPFELTAPTAVIGHQVFTGEGLLLSDFTMLTGDLRVGAQFQCNIYSYVAHNCVIGDYVTFAPRVCCNGNVHIDDDAYIGTGAVLRQGTAEKPLRIGKGATVGMGAVVTKDVPEGAVVVGNPARPLERPSGS
ncbi:acetyltransferase [Parablastomonas sp. CN1-191]|uniref:PglD-related sugar-binding protein n=1 Tax=Parablastomonas sp. CN1-191 TaxID=3400908 RepID=UPI003BF7CCE7